MLPSLAKLARPTPGTDAAFEFCDYPEGDERLNAVGGDDLSHTGRFRIRQTTGDGSCLFHALLQLAKDPTIRGAAPKVDATTAGELRHDVIDWLVQHPDNASKMIKIMEGGVSVREYANSMRSSHAFGGATEIQAFAMMAKCVVYVVGLNDPANPNKYELEAKRHARIISKYWPCAKDGGPLSLRDVQRLSVLVLVFHHLNRIPHYSSVHSRPAGSSAPAPAPVPAPAPARGPQVIARRKKAPKLSGYDLVRDLSRDREARKACARNDGCKQKSGCAMDDETAREIERIVRLEEQENRDRLFALSLSRE